MRFAVGGVPELCRFGGSRGKLAGFLAAWSLATFLRSTLA